MKKLNKKKEYPVRTCISCGGRFLKKDLLRHVWGETKPVPDGAQLLAGRGAYCCMTEECTDKFYSAGKRWNRVFHLS